MSRAPESLRPAPEDASHAIEARTEAISAQESPRPALVRHPRANGGALYAGGVPGNAGGPGRPASAVRSAARESFAQRIPVLETIADGEVEITLSEVCPSCGYRSPGPQRVSLRTAAADRVKALDLLQRVGIPQQRELVLPEVRERLAATILVLREELGHETYERLEPRLSRIWRGEA